MQGIAVIMAIGLGCLAIVSFLFRRPTPGFLFTLAAAGSFLVAVRVDQ